MVGRILFDGSCCAIINGEFYKRYDAKNGKPVPDGAIKCQEEADQITGHLPCWVKVDDKKPGNKWFMEAYRFTHECLFNETDLADGTYEAVGKHFSGNPYNLGGDMLFKHGIVVVEVDRSFKGIKEFLSEHHIEGLVFWLDGEPKCKIKRSDFGLRWEKNN